MRHSIILKRIKTKKAELVIFFALVLGSEKKSRPFLKNIRPFFNEASRNFNEASRNFQGLLWLVFDARLIFDKIRLKNLNLIRRFCFF